MSCTKLPAQLVNLEPVKWQPARPGLELIGLELGFMGQFQSAYDFKMMDELFQIE